MELVNIFYCADFKDLEFIVNEWLRKNPKNQIITRLLSGDTCALFYKPAKKKRVKK